jgi:hypothetical protein
VLILLADIRQTLAYGRYVIANYPNGLLEFYSFEELHWLTFELPSGCRTEQQILADYTSMQTKISAEFWADLKAQNLIEQNAPVPQEAQVSVG